MLRAAHEPAAIFLMALVVGLVSPSHGQVADASQLLSPMAIARETSDPTSDLWYLFTEFAFATTPGRPFDRTNQMTLELQPSMPVPLTDSLRLLNYPQLVLASQGTPHGTQANGIQSFSWIAALSPVAPRLGLAWGLGPYVSFPVATNGALGSDPWLFGPGGVVAWRSETNLASALVNLGWNPTGQSREAGALQIDYNLQHFFENGTQIGLGHPHIEYTWDRSGRGGWDIPIGVDVAKVFHIGRLPLKMMLEYDFYVVNDSRWGYRNGYFWGTGFAPASAGGAAFTEIGSVTPEGNVLFNVLVDGELTNLTGQIAGDAATGTMALRGYVGTESFGDAAVATVAPEPGTAGLLFAAGGAGLLAVRMRKRSAHAPR